MKPIDSLFAHVTAPRCTALVCVVAFAACSETQGNRVGFDLVAHGGASTFAVGAWQVTLTDARVGVGPLYLCSSATPDVELCDVAAAQFLQTGVVDALSAEVQPLGTVQGVTEIVRSALFDYGMTWLFTRPKPLANDGAPEGSSAVIMGSASRDAQSFSFYAKLNVLAQRAGDPAVRAVVPERKLDDVSSLTLHFNPEAWFSAVDFDALAQGVANDSVEIAAGTQAYDALIQALTATALPEFTWQ